VGEWDKTAVRLLICFSEIYIREYNIYQRNAGQWLSAARMLLLIIAGRVEADDGAELILR
jgi:hypothetical protein